ncbi:hypothetical protein [Chroococcidiopsis thermalis]|uniref:Uncharacterized protein n=1 Tax=Chroococcidiopsis thermalis (strain PCC 7203) TaxID=251229 RepID=K9U894_CHRTP|nr:hypothetical protein [Chroococcidiopsis thermalis]AFY91277.1 hypothetical protein Chro_5943 [Chroococcidiopsis thermalis PCC 7203]
MKVSKYIILAAAFIGIWGFSGAVRAKSAIESQRTTALAKPNEVIPSYKTNLIGQARDINSQLEDSKEVPDPSDDRDSEVKDDKVPAALSQVGEYGESIYDMAKINNWTKATANLNSLQSAAKQLDAQIDGKSQAVAQLNSSIAALSQAVNAKDRQSAMRDANQVTLIAAKMTVPFEPKVPVEVTLLDYYGRELDIWAAQGNTAKLRTTTGEMRRTWNALRPSILARGGSAQVKKFDTLITRIEAAKSTSEYGRLATPILDEVDNLEKVFQ